VLSIDSTVAIPCLSLEELGFLNEKKPRTRRVKLMMREATKTIQTIAGKKNKKKNNSFIQA
jgi:hypothetical protein